MCRRTDKIRVTCGVPAPHPHSPAASGSHFLSKELLVYNFTRLVLTRSTAVLAKAAHVVASFAFFTASLKAPSADFTRSSLGQQTAESRANVAPSSFGQKMHKSGQYSRIVLQSITNELVHRYVHLQGQPNAAHHVLNLGALDRTVHPFAPYQVKPLKHDDNRFGEENQRINPK